MPFVVARPAETGGYWVAAFDPDIGTERPSTCGPWASHFARRRDAVSRLMAMLAAGVRAPEGRTPWGVFRTESWSGGTLCPMPQRARRRRGAKP